MQLPTGSSGAISSTPSNFSLEEYIKASTKNLLQTSTSLSGGNTGPGNFLNFDGTTGMFKYNREEIENDELGILSCPASRSSKAALSGRAASPSRGSTGSFSGSRTRNP